MIKKYFIVIFMSVLIPTIAFAETINDTQIHPGTLDTPQINPPTQGVVLTEEEMIRRQEQIDQFLNRSSKKDNFNSSNISFISDHKISISPGLAQNISYDAGYYVIQFYASLGSVDVTTRDKIEELDIALLQYINDNAFYAKIPKSAFDSIDGLVLDKKIRYVGNIPLDAKIRQAFQEELKNNSDSMYGVTVFLFERPTISQLIKLELDMDVYSYSDVTYFVYGSASGNDIVDISKMDFVKFIERQASASVSSADNDDKMSDIEVLRLAVFSSLTFFIGLMVLLVLFAFMKKRKKRAQKTEGMH
ncbi:MAG: hypothetical protein GQ477_00585 [Nanohaloarchaea archaeon]|nr:hypothetical protein [Candidatus Nanohaloarchaea archaeon]